LHAYLLWNSFGCTKPLALWLENDINIFHLVDALTVSSMVLHLVLLELLQVIWFDLIVTCLCPMSSSRNAASADRGPVPTEIQASVFTWKSFRQHDWLYGNCQSMRSNKCRELQITSQISAMIILICTGSIVWKFQVLPSRRVTLWLSLQKMLSALFLLQSALRCENWDVKLRSENWMWNWDFTKSLVMCECCYLAPVLGVFF
jgi:hypothetical protein